MSLSVSDLLYRYLQLVMPSGAQADNLPSTYTPGSLAGQAITTDTAFATGRVVAPAAFTIIGQTAALTGMYMVEATAVFGLVAPVDPTDTNNIRISVGANAKIVLPIPPAINVPVTVKGYFRANAETIRIGSAGNAATAGVLYAGAVTATRIGD